MKKIIFILTALIIIQLGNAQTTPPEFRNGLVLGDNNIGYKEGQMRYNESALEIFDGTVWRKVGDNDLTQVTTNATNYTLLESDINDFKIHRFTGDDITITIPATGFTSNKAVVMIHEGSGTVTVQSGAGVTFDDITFTSNLSFSIYETSDDSWILFSREIEGAIPTIAQVVGVGNEIPFTIPLIFKGVNGLDAVFSKSVGSDLMLTSTDGFQFRDAVSNEFLKTAINGAGFFSSRNHSDFESINAIDDGNIFTQRSFVTGRFKGDWNASTNTPTLSNTDNREKSVSYKVTVAGTVNFGAGNITFAIGDIVANDGTLWYKRVNNNQSGTSTASYEILVNTGIDDDVQAALDTAGEIPVRITADIINLDRPILMNSNQTLIFEGYTIFVANDVSGGGIDPFAYWNGHAVIKNRNGAGIGAGPAGDWGGTGLGGESNITIIGGTIDGTNEDPLYGYNGVQLHNVTDSKVVGVKCINVLKRTSAPTGNFDTRNSQRISFINVESTNTDKTGLWANDTEDLLIQGGKFILSGDSGIGGEANIRPVIDGVYVDNAGRLPNPNGASNITMDMRDGKFINSTSINASGSTNGYGLTLGHPDPDFAYNTLVSNNLFQGNSVNGIRIQGASTRGLTITGNTFIDNGNGSTDSGAGGVNINAGKGIIVSSNYFQNNRHGVITSNGATSNVIENNIIEDSNQFGVNLASNNNIVRNNQLLGNLVVQVFDGGTGNLMYGNTHSDGGAYTTDIQETFTIKTLLPLDANLMTGSLLKLQPSSGGLNNAVTGSSSGISMQIDGRAGLYGMTAATYVKTDRSDFEYRIKAHKGTEAGVELFTLDDTGILNLPNSSIANIATNAKNAVTYDALQDYVANNSGGGGISHAPSDSKFYASKDGAWSELNPISNLQVETIDERYEGANVVFFGTSITRADGGTLGANSEGGTGGGEVCIGYVTHVSNALEFGTFDNQGTSGRAIAENSGNVDSALGRQAITNYDFTNIDLAFIEHGVNDFGFERPIGTIGTYANTTFDLETFYGGYRTALDHIFTSNPETEVILITQTQRMNSSEGQDFVNAEGHKQIDYVNAVKALGEMYGLKVVDNYSSAGINIRNMTSFSYDLLHPNNKGHLKMAENIVREIASAVITYADSDNVIAGNDFEFTVISDNGGTSNSDQFTIPLVANHTTNASVFVDGVNVLTLTGGEVDPTLTFASAGTHTIKIIGTLNGWKFNNGGDKFKMGNIINWGTFEMDKDGAFYGCSNITSTATNAPTITTTSLANAWRGAINFNTSIENLELPNGTSLNSALRNASGYDQSFANLDMTGVDNFGNFLNGGGISTANYDATLIAWEAQLQAEFPNGVGYTSAGACHFGNSTYTLGGSAETARTSLETVYGFVFTDGGGI